MSMQMTTAPLPAPPARLREGVTLPAGLRVLMVEDESQVGRVIKSMLERLRCKPTAAQDAFDAMTAFDPEAFDLVLVDVVMPGMTGFDLVDCLRERAPDLSYLYMSGYPAVGAVAELMGIARPLICKPFTQRELAYALARVHADPACGEIFGNWPSL